MTNPEDETPKTGGWLCSIRDLLDLSKDPYAKEWSGKVSKPRKSKRESEPK